MRKLQICQTWGVGIFLGVKVLMYVIALGYLGYLRALFSGAATVRGRQRTRRWLHAVPCMRAAAAAAVLFTHLTYYYGLSARRECIP